MQKEHSADKLFKVLNEHEDEIINCFGSDWQNHEEKYRLLIKDLQDPEEKTNASIEIVELISKNPKASKLILNALRMQDEVYAFFYDIKHIQNQLGLSEKTLLGIDDLYEITRSISIKNPTKIKSLKIGNIEADFSEISMFSAGLITSVINNFSEKESLLLAAGIILLLKSVYDAMSVELSEQEATVFYGFTLAANSKKNAKQIEIKKKTNEIRSEIGLKELKDLEVQNSLFKLSEIKAVEKKDEHWQIIEKYKLPKDKRR